MIQEECIGNKIEELSVLCRSKGVNYNVVKETLSKFAEWLLSNQWISVDEALPEYEERVLVAHQHGYQGASLYKDSSYQYWGVAKDSPIGADVTHWMSIPKLKEE